MPEEELIKYGKSILQNVIFKDIQPAEQMTEESKALIDQRLATLGEGERLAVRAAIESQATAAKLEQDIQAKLRSDVAAAIDALDKAIKKAGSQASLAAMKQETFNSELAKVRSLYQGRRKSKQYYVNKQKAMANRVAKRRRKKKSK